MDEDAGEDSPLLAEGKKCFYHQKCKQNTLGLRESNKRGRKTKRGGNEGPLQSAHGGSVPLPVSKMQHFGSRLGLLFLPWVRRIGLIGPPLLAFLNPFGLNLVIKQKFAIRTQTSQDHA